MKKLGFSVEPLERRQLLSASLIQDGGFETPVITSTTAGYDLYHTGDALGPWTVVGAQGTVGTLSTFEKEGAFTFNAEAGLQSLDLTGLSNTVTGVSQTIATTIGTTYTLAFSVGNIVDSTGVFGSSSSVQVMINSVVTQTAVNSNNGGSIPYWMPFKSTFVATTTSTTIAFINGDGSSDNYNGLDDVSITTGNTLAFKQPPTDGTADQPADPAVSVEIDDSTGAVDTTDNSTVVTLNPVGFTSDAPIKNNTATAVNGVATFSDLSLTKPGFYTLQATDANNDGPATSDKFKITGDHLVIAKQPPAANDAGSPISLSVKIENAAGDLDKDATTFAGLSLNIIVPGNNPTLSGTISAPFVGGIATFKTSAAPAVDVAGTYTFTVTEEELSTDVLVPTNTSASVDTDNFKINGAHLAFMPGPHNADVNDSIPLQVAVVNSKGQVDKTQNGPGVLLTLNALSSTATPTLTGVTTSNFVNGRANFTAAAGPMIGIAGDYTFTATDPTSPAIAGADSKQFTIAGFHLVFKKQVTQADVYAPIVLTVQLLDAHNKLVTTENTATVSLSFVAKVGGVGAAASGTLVQALTGGIADFPVSAAPNLSVAGVYRFTATETGTPSPNTSVDSTKPGQSNPITIATYHFIYLVPPKNTNTDDPFPVTVALVDKKGTRWVAQSADTVQLSLNTISGGTGAVLMTTTLQKLFVGAAQFTNLFINAGGVYTITATEIDATTGAPSNASVPFASNRFTVEALHVEVTKQPKDVLPYSQIPYGFALEDSHHKIDTAAIGYGLTVNLVTIHDGAGASFFQSAAPGVVQFVNGVIDDSQVAFSLTNNPGTFSFTVDATSQNPTAALITSGKTKPFKVLPLHVAILNQPSDVPAYGALDIRVALEGPNKEIDTDASSFPDITLNTLSGGEGATVLGLATLLNSTDNTFTDGVFDFGNYASSAALSIDTPGTYTFTVGETLGPADGGPVAATTPITTDPFKVTPDQLVFTQQPADAAVGAPIPVKVTLEDVNGNTFRNEAALDAVLTLQTISGGNGAVLGGNSQIQLNTSGLADFSSQNLSINVPGTYQLMVTLTNTLSPTSNVPAAVLSQTFTIS